MGCQLCIGITGPEEDLAVVSKEGIQRDPDFAMQILVWHPRFIEIPVQDTRNRLGGGIDEAKSLVDHRDAL